MVTSEQLALRLFRFLCGRSWTPSGWITDTEYQLLLDRLIILVEEWGVEETDLVDLPYDWPESMQIVD